MIQWLYKLFTIKLAIVTTTLVTVTAVGGIVAVNFSSNHKNLESAHSAIDKIGKALTNQITNKASSETNKKSGQSGYEGDAPACTMYADPDTIELNGSTTLVWHVNKNVISGYLHSKASKHWKQTIDLNGTWSISGITDNQDYILTVESANQQTADCDAHITVINK